MAKCNPNDKSFINCSNILKNPKNVLSHLESEYKSMEGTFDEYFRCL